MSTLKDVKHYVIGGGPVGRTLLRQLVESGVTPTLISRSRRESDTGVQIVGAIGDADVQDQINDGSVLYHCANAPYHRWAEELPALWDAVLEVAIRKRCKLVVATNLYAYGRPDGEITESHTKHPHTRKGALRKEIESKIIDAVKAGQIQATMIRGSDFFGPGVNDSALGKRFFSSLIRGKQPVFTGALDQPHSYTYLPDFGRAMIAAAEKLVTGTSDERVELIVPNSEAESATQLARRLEAILERKLKPRGMGAAALRFGGVFVPSAREVIEMLYEFDLPFVADGSAASNYLGIKATPLDRALSETVAWYRTQSSPAAVDV